MDQLYLDNIDEYVQDQDKIVTYKWLSLTLGVHVNTAKQMLYHYLEHKRKESSGPLHATYLVSGKSVDKGQTCHKVAVVREEELEEAKSKLSVVVSVHVYSVHKALLRDSAPLYSVDYDAVRSNLLDCNRYSAIRCPAAVPLSTAEPQQARETQQTPPPEVHKRESNSGAKTCPKPKGIMGVFANKAASKTQETKAEPRDEEPAVEVPKSKAVAKTNPAANFFGNQAAKKPVKAVKEEEMVRSSSTSEQQKQDVPTEQPPPPPETKRDARSKSKRLEESDSEQDRMEKKKRRRIKKPVSDSSDEDVIPDSPEQKTQQTSPGPVREEPVAKAQKTENPLKTRKRRRVLKSHTFLDEDGCMVTEKGYESESYSESDEDDQRKPAPRAAPGKPQNKPRDEKKKKTPASSSNRGSKQASIMGFLQKK